LHAFRYLPFLPLNRSGCAASAPQSPVTVPLFAIVVPLRLGAAQIAHNPHSGKN
jgi:hypothetical protein